MQSSLHEERCIEEREGQGVGIIGDEVERRGQLSDHIGVRKLLLKALVVKLERQEFRISQRWAPYLGRVSLEIA